MLLMTAISGGFLALAAGEETAAKSPESKSEKISYALGVSTARTLKQQDLTLDVEHLIQGLKDGLSGSKLALPEEELSQLLTVAQNELRRKQVMAKRNEAVETRLAGVEFLTQNKTNAGVVELPSGLQYKILSAGEGPKPTLKDTVELRFRSTFIDGKEFESTPPNGLPLITSVATMIPAWKEAVQLMPVGSKWQLFAPSHLGYGPRGLGAVPGHTTLIFELELLGIKSPKAE
jgi:FKBP-type peptidyl-prolyl cis-trans isomerase FklB